jgi:hypothetical protein
MSGARVGQESGSTPVIVRSFRDEPVRMRVVSTSDDSVDVAREGSDATLGMAIGYVYKFQEELFRRLRELFVSGDAEALRREWKTAAPYSGG